MVAHPSRPPPPPPDDTAAAQRAINLPPVVTALIVANVAVYLVVSVLPWRWELGALLHLGFVPARYTIGSAFAWPALVAPVTHQFLHGGVLHLLVNMVMLAAFGSGVERLLGGGRMLALYVVCGMAGALAHLAFYPESTTPVIGASGAISGLFGAVLRLIARHPRVGGGVKRVLPVAAIWVVVAIVTGFTGLPGDGGAQVAWAAHVGGFLLALALFDLFAWRANRRSR
jgi:membrane associated rhomboid family serine protease